MTSLLLEYVYFLGAECMAASVFSFAVPRVFSSPTGNHQRSAPSLTFRLKLLTFSGGPHPLIRRIYIYIYHIMQTERYNFFEAAAFTLKHISQ